MNRLLYSIGICFAIVFSVAEAPAQKVVPIRDHVEHYIFSYDEIEYVEDKKGEITIEQISSGAFDETFKKSRTFSPENYNRESFYWYRIRVNHNGNTKKQWQIEFFDQTIDHIEFFTPEPSGTYRKQSFGDSYAFLERGGLLHKNFVVRLPGDFAGEYTYYFKVKSDQRADILIVLRTEEFFFNYALDEYFFFGVFYGMILVFCFYNLLLFAAVRERHYLYYVLYLVGIGLYEMSADGIAFQYLWPNAIEWNQYATGFSLYVASTFSLLFAISLLNLRKQYPKLLNLLVGVFLFRTAFLIVSFFVSYKWFNFRFIDAIPFTAVLFAGIYCLRKGYQPARFLVVGYTFLFLGMVIKIIQFIDFNWRPLGDLTHYGLGFGFIMEIMFLSFAIRDKIKLLRLEKEKAQESVIEQLQENQKLKDELNQRLEEQVKMKVKELIEANQKLAQQADEIAAMNALLKQDNIQLKHDVEVVTEARILSKEVDFEEFSAMYPDDASCLKFLADKKWEQGYTCTRCSYMHYSDGRTPYSRRCTRCGYDESPTAYTLLQNTRLPINKAFYMVFLVYSSKGNISSHKLSEILNIRQSTCWSYSSKIKKAIKETKRSRTAWHEGWDSILLVRQTS